MKTNKILIFAALGIGALLLFSGKKDNESGEGASGMFTLPDGTKVPESQLPSLGYIRHEGQWKHQSELTTPDMPANVDPNSPQWLSILNASLQSGSQLYSMSSELASAISRSIKSTAVNWDNKVVTVNIKFGFQVYNGVVTPTTNTTKTYSDQQIIILGKGPQAKITLLKGGAVQKEAIIDFNTKKLIGFSAGSVGITGLGYVNNLDTVTSMYGIGSVPKKNITYKGYNIRVLNSGGYFETYLPNYTKFVQTDTLKGIKELIKKDIKLEEDRYGSIGSIYKYNHPKGITYCNDKTYSDAAKGACSYHGGAAEVKFLQNTRDYSGRGQYVDYGSYRKAYKNSWAKMNRADKVVTL